MPCSTVRCICSIVVSIIEHIRTPDVETLDLQPVNLLSIRHVLNFQYLTVDSDAYRQMQITEIHVL